SITTDSPQSPEGDAGTDQTVSVVSVVTLNGAGSDSMSLPLTYQWAIISQPEGSHAVLSSASAANPAFIADQPGTYIAQLMVNNGLLDSAPATVTITTAKTA